MHVCIVGAGVIGTTTAWQLARQGMKVTLLEAGDGPGLGTSYANGGQLSYSYVAPLADPSVLPSLPKWLLDRRSPLRFRPRMDVHQWRWCLRFLRNCDGTTAKRTTAAMLTLSYLSRDTLHRWMDETPLEFHHRSNGKLIAYRSPELLEKARKLVEYQAAHGAQQKVLSRAESIDLEPSLAGLDTSLAGCIYTPGEEVGDCYLFTKALYDALAKHPQVTIRNHAQVSRLVQREGRIVAAELADGGQIEADQFILANGLGARKLLRQQGGNAMIYGLKGYSLSVPRTQGTEAAAPEISVTDYERRIVYAPIGPVLRIAAMVDIGGDPGAANPQRIGQLKNQVKETFPGLAVDEAVGWSGERPATPDSKPIIGRSKAADNLWLNIGHGALGFTLACGSAALLGAQLQGDRAPIDPRPFAER